MVSPLKSNWKTGIMTSLLMEADNKLADTIRVPNKMEWGIVESPFPFIEGKAERGMGLMRQHTRPIPTLTLPLKGRDFKGQV
jgi:hypothetical protein